MLSEHEERFRRLVNDYLERPGGDYGELLQRGFVSSPEGVDPEAWRDQIRRQARQDKVRVSTSRQGDRAFAARERTVPADEAAKELRYEFDRSQVLQKLARAARELGHDPTAWLRSDEEHATLCTRCGARIYARAGGETVVDGEMLTEPCC